MQIPGLPAQSRSLFTRLYQEPTIATEDLIDAVQGYRQYIEVTYRKTRQVNVDVGIQLEKAALGLLKSISNKTSEQSRRLIQAAVRYFVLEDDGNGSDLASLDGLDDDAMVMNAVLRYLGLDRLKVSLSYEQAALTETELLPSPTND